MHVRTLLAETISRFRSAASGRFWGRQLRQGTANAFWLGVPEIAGWVNKKVSGSETIWPLSWFMFSIQGTLPVNRALSIGCGAGNLEREVIRHGGARHIDAIDVSSESLATAERLAREQGISQFISYGLSDALTALRTADANKTRYDLIFFHASLHHIEALEEVLSVCSRLASVGTPGLVYIDEYVGPSRNEWKPEDLGYACALFKLVPPDARLGTEVGPPVAFSDPTEMIRSSEIPPMIERFLDVVDRKPYFGNVLMPLVAALKEERIYDPEVREVLRKAMLLEDFLIDQRLLSPMYAVYVTKPKRDFGEGFRAGSNPI